MKSKWLTHQDDPTCIGMLLLWDSTILLPSAKSYTFAIKYSLIRTFPLFKSRWICNAIDDIQSNPNPLFPVFLKKKYVFLFQWRYFNERRNEWMNEWMNEWNFEEYLTNCAHILSSGHIWWDRDVCQCIIPFLHHHHLLSLSHLPSSLLFSFNVLLCWALHSSSISCVCFVFQNDGWEKKIFGEFHSSICGLQRWTNSWYLWRFFSFNCSGFSFFKSEISNNFLISSVNFFKKKYSNHSCWRKWKRVSLFHQDVRLFDRRRTWESLFFCNALIKESGRFLFPDSIIF